MAATLYNLIVKGCTISFAGAPSNGFKNKLNIIAANFSTLQGFKQATIASLNNIKTIEGDSAFRPLTEKEERAVTSFQNDIETDKSLVQNFIKILTKEFVNKQIAMLSTISIDSFNANPILCSALNLKTPEEFVRYNAYQAIALLHPWDSLCRTCCFIQTNMYLTVKHIKREIKPNLIW